jgi:hypothetical protein
MSHLPSGTKDVKSKRKVVRAHKTLIRRGFRHGDESPANMLGSHKGKPAIIDFERSKARRRNILSEGKNYKPSSAKIDPRDFDRFGHL